MPAATDEFVAALLWPAIFWSRALRIDGPDLDEQAIFQGRDSSGDTHSFIEAVGQDGPIATDYFFGFAKWTIEHLVLPANGFSFIREAMPGFDFFLLNQPIVPSVKLSDSFLDIISGERAIPLSTRKHQVFASRKLFGHKRYSVQVSPEAAVSVAKLQ